MHRRNFLHVRCAGCAKAMVLLTYIEQPFRMEALAHASVGNTVVVLAVNTPHSSIASPGCTHLFGHCVVCCLAVLFRMHGCCYALHSHRHSAAALICVGRRLWNGPHTFLLQGFSFCVCGLPVCVWSTKYIFSEPKPFCFNVPKVHMDVPG